MKNKYPGIVIAGIGGDSGKTFLTTGIMAALKSKGYSIAPFKKGPDYIDPAWMRIASGQSVRNLDTFLMQKQDIVNTYISHSEGRIGIIEGNRGLYDGFDTEGTHSTASLAKLLNLPVILVLNVTKVTRTVAAIVLGMKNFDPELNIAGVVLNKAGGKRHSNLVKQVVEESTGIPVVAVIPRVKKTDVLPSRHLGLIMPKEYGKAEAAIVETMQAIAQHVDLDKIIEIAGSGGQGLEYIKSPTELKDASGLKIGYMKDKVFSFYYDENLEFFEEAGAELVAVSSVEDPKLPIIDCLYIAGGFPETNLDDLNKNRELMRDIKKAADNGLPIYAECGGLMYMAESIEVDGKEHPMTGVLPLKVKMEKRPQGHGYCTMVADKNNPYFVRGTKINGHEFHYSRITYIGENLETCMKMELGTGSIDKRDGFIYKKVFAAYTHLHAIGAKEWVNGMINQAVLYKADN